MVMIGEIGGRTELFVNPAACASADPPRASWSDLISRAALANARFEIENWPGYAPTPLIELGGLAERMGIASLLVKDEGRRFGQGSFKALGAPYAIGRLVRRHLRERHQIEASTTAALLAEVYSDLTREITVIAATTGNHGRGLAFGAQLFGCRCMILCSETVRPERRAAIEALGARLEIVPGGYEDAVAEAERRASADPDWYVVSDTAYDSNIQAPLDVMHGYALIAHEIVEELPRERLPTHVFLQGGVGGFAAALTAAFWLALGEQRPRVVIVEPDSAACLMESAKAGRPMRLQHAPDTSMLGMATIEVSQTAWPILQCGAGFFMTIEDTAARSAMRIMADPAALDPPIVLGESGVAGIAAAILVSREETLRGALGLDAESRILTVGTEGAVEPERYRQIVGRTAASFMHAGE